MACHPTGGVGQDPGELLPVSRAAAAQEPDSVSLALQHAEHAAIDAAGCGDLPEQVGVLAGSAPPASALPRLRIR